jgi:hypothetical protein
MGSSCKASYGRAVFDADKNLFFHSLRPELPEVAGENLNCNCSSMDSHFMAIIGVDGCSSEKRKNLFYRSMEICQSVLSIDRQRLQAGVLLSDTGNKAVVLTSG